MVPSSLHFQLSAIYDWEVQIIIMYDVLRLVGLLPVVVVAVELAAVAAADVVVLIFPASRSNQRTSKKDVGQIKSPVSYRYFIVIGLVVVK